MRLTKSLCSILCQYAILLTLLFSLSASASRNAEPVNVYIVAGQSNACGAGSKLTDFRPMAVDTNILFFYKIFKGAIGSTLDPNNDANWYKPTVLTTLFPVAQGRFGSEIQLARAMVFNEPGVKVMIIKVCAGASALFRDWTGGGPDIMVRHLIPTVREGINRATGLGYMPAIKGFFWIQGESDVPLNETRRFYAGGLHFLVETLRTEFQTQFAAVIARIRGPSATPVTEPKLAEVRSKQTKYANCNTFGTWINVDNLLAFSDNIHWDFASHLRVGSRLAYAYRILKARGVIAPPSCAASVAREWRDYRDL